MTLREQIDDVYVLDVSAENNVNVYVYQDRNILFGSMWIKVSYIEKYHNDLVCKAHHKEVL